MTHQAIASTIGSPPATNVRPGSKVYTDELLSYDGLESDYVHKVINHAEQYADGYAEDSKTSETAAHTRQIIAALDELFHQAKYGS